MLVRRVPLLQPDMCLCPGFGSQVARCSQWDDIASRTERCLLSIFDILGAEQRERTGLGKGWAETAGGALADIFVCLVHSPNILGSGLRLPLRVFGSVSLSLNHGSKEHEG